MYNLTMLRLFLLVLVLLSTTFVYSREEGCFGVLMGTTAMDSGFSHEADIYCSNVTVSKPSEVTLQHLYLVEVASICNLSDHAGKFYPNDLISTELDPGYSNSLAESADSPIYLAGNWTSQQMEAIKTDNHLTDFQMFSSVSSTVLVEALAQFISFFKRTRVTIIADFSQSFYLRTAEEVYRTSSHTSDFNFVQLQNSDSDIHKTLSMIEHSRIGIIFLSLRPTLVQRLLCARHLVNFTVTNLWITHSVDFRQFLKNCSENVVVFQQRRSEESLASGNLENEFKFDRLVIISNGLSDVRMNQNSCHHYFSSKNVSVIDIYQWVEQAPLFLSNYSIANGLGRVTLRGPVPSDYYPPQYAPITFIAVCFLSIALCFMVVTVILVVYFYFRKEPAVRASSVTLSILIFAGCYFLMFYLLVLNTTLIPGYHKKSILYRNLVCVVRVWLHGLGYPTALILSTLLVKLIRIYRLFYNFSDVKKYECIDVSLALYVLLMTSPCFLICLIWCTSDPYISVVKTTTKDGFLHVLEQCESKHTKTWLIFLLVYMLLLCVLLMVMATLTRKIKHSNFKDTKKINALSYILVLSLCVTFFYWYIFRLLSLDYLYIHSLLQFSHYAILLECQFFLFLPKLIPIIRKRYRSHK